MPLRFARSLIPRVPAPLRALLLATCVSSASLLAALPAGVAHAAETFTPDPSALVQTPRPCPAPTVAAADDASCWSASLDQGNPLYSAGDPYAWGQCTYWVLEMRADIWNNRSAADPAASGWAAYTWPAHASLEGLVVNDLPAPGAVMVWPQSSDDPAGHVSYVQSVAVDPATGNDLVTVQEFNNGTFDDASQGQGDTITLPFSASALSRVQFIQAPGYVASSPTHPAQATTASPPTATTARVKTPSPPVRVSSQSHNPRLRVTVSHARLLATTRSPAALRATVSRRTGRRVVRRLPLRAGAGATLHLSAGRYRICVEQPATARWKRASVCETAVAR